ncbi:MAG: polysaccharide deacetylase family protein [Flavobacteriales bacterium]|nr:polysaccharide deacetylase family protein [Flavobacteriales bacterium]
MYLVKPPYLLRKYLSECIWRMPNNNCMYLTFDDGPTPEITEWVLDLLAEKQIKATFFCVGNAVNKNPALFGRITAEGHAIGNHTYNHLNGWKTDDTTYYKDIAKAQSLIPSKLFRPPYGRISKRQAKQIKHDYKIILWDIISGDFDTETSKEKCLSNVVKNARGGSIIVFHDSHKASENLKYSLPLVIDYFLNKGITFNKLTD